MKIVTQATFDADYKRLKPEHKQLFRQALKKFLPAVAAREADPHAPWPQSLRIKPLRHAPGIWEMTWSFSGPDGRATFGLTQVGEELTVVFRRVGTHAVFAEP